MICPGCGLNLAAETPLHAGIFRYEPRRGLLVDGERIPAEPAAHAMIGAVMSARGKVMTIQVLANRQNEDTADAVKLVNSYTYRLRQAFAACDVDPPFEVITRVGLRWTGPEVETDA